jgi:hypothetical protein
MPLLLRSFFTMALVGSMSFASHAQSQTPVTLPAASEAATVAPAAPAPLLPPAQMKDGKYKDYLSKRYADDKEASAAVHLFRRKQTGGVLWLSTGAATIGLIASQTGTQTNDAGVTTTFEVTPVGYGLLVGLFGGVGIGKLSRFGDDKLYQALASYEQSQTLPAYVKKKIKTNDRN